MSDQGFPIPYEAFLEAYLTTGLRPTRNEWDDGNGCVCPLGAIAVSAGVKDVLSLTFGQLIEAIKTHGYVVTMEQVRSFVDGVDEDPSYDDGEETTDECNHAGQAVWQRLCVDLGVTE